MEDGVDKSQPVKVIKFHTSCYMLYLFTAVDCGPLSPPSNGDIRVSNTLFGSSARYSCFPGYKLAGLSFRVCQLDGTWSGNAPICESI